MDRDIPRFWESDNNGVADDGSVTLRPVGTWSTTQETSLSVAVAQWRDNTDFDPTYSASSGPVNVFVNGNVLWCVSSPPPGWLGHSCEEFEIRTGTVLVWEDIGDAAVLINGPNQPLTWRSVGDDAKPNKYSFRGILTHEIGDTAGLGHEDTGCGSAADTRPTMCAGHTKEQSYKARTLEHSDKTSVNIYY